MKSNQLLRKWRQPLGTGSRATRRDLRPPPDSSTIAVPSAELTVFGSIGGANRSLTVFGSVAIKAGPLVRCLLCLGLIGDVS